MEQLLQPLRAVAELTRLRLLALLAATELTVSELTRILGQSQPRISRHLKLMVEGGLLERFQEGSWAFYRLADGGTAGTLASAVLALVPANDPLIALDRERLDAIRAERQRTATAYFAAEAERWDRIRSLYVSEAEVEAAMLATLDGRHPDTLLDIGTGTARVLEVFAARIKHGIGVDLSREMLTVARANLDRASLRHCQVRHGDLYRLALPAGCADLVTLHHVLHFLTDPGAAIAEAARTLRPNGQLLVVDFAPHGLEFLRTEHAHRRLGFTAAEIAGWCEAAGLEHPRARHLQAGGRAGAGQLTVTLWTANQRADAPAHHRLEVA